MTSETMNLKTLIEKIPDAELSRENTRRFGGRRKVGFAADLHRS
jgi:hypothetical protein